MKYKSTLLLLVAVVIASIVAYSLSKKPTSEEIDEQRTRLLSEMKSEDIQTLTIEEGGKRLVCQRDPEADGGWRITEPVRVRADRWEVEGILDKLEMAQKVSTTRPPAGETFDLSQYGLDEPARKVTLGGRPAAGRSWTILIGKETGIADAVYAAVEGRDAVYAINRDVAERTDVTLTDLRSKNLAPRISVLDRKKIAISAAQLDESPAFEVECEKSDGKWELKKPLYQLADPTRVEDLANKLYNHRIGTGDFVVDDPTKAAEYGLDSPFLTLTIEGKHKTQTVVFSRLKEEDQTSYYALHKGEPAIVKVPESLFTDLRKEPEELREKSLADFTVADIAEVTVEGPQGEFVLKKKDDAWEIAADTPVAADDGVIDEVLRELRNADVQDFVADEPEDLGAYGLSEGARTHVTLRDEDGEMLAELFLGAADEAGESVYAQRPPYPAVVSTRNERYLENIIRGRVAFLGRLVLEEPWDEAREVSLERATERFLCTWNETDVEWELAAPVQGKADSVAVRAIVSDFAHLRAEAFAAEDAQDLAAFGLDEPMISVTVTYRAKSEETEEQEDEAEPQERVRSLHIGSAAQEPAEGYFAKLAEDGRVFVLPDYVVRHFRANLASKRISHPFDIVAMTFRKGHKLLEFRHDEEKDIWTDGEGKELAEDMAKAVKDAARLLKDFRGVEVADYTEKDPALYGFDDAYLVVELEEIPGQVKKLVIGKETEGGNRYAKGPATDFVLVAEKPDVDKLLAVLEPPAEESEGPAPETRTAQEDE